MSMLLMPQATAVWLIENTTLTFQQVAAVVGLHDLQIQAIADGEIAKGMPGDDPILKGQFTAEEIARCEADPTARLKLAESAIPDPVARKGPRYTPIAKRQNKPDAIAWLLREHPEITDAQIQRLLGTTKPTITKIREGTHQNMANIQPTHPLEIGLCTRADFLAALEKAEKAQERAAKRQAAAARKAARKATTAGTASVDPATTAPAVIAPAPTPEPVASVTPAPVAPAPLFSGGTLAPESTDTASAEPGAESDSGSEPESESRDDPVSETTRTLPEN